MFIIAGAANNILLDPVKHGLELMNRNILFAPDYVINAGGLINVANEIEGYDEVKVKTDTEKIYDTLLNIYVMSENEKIPTVEASDKLAQQIIDKKKLELHKI
jgi:Glutamate dehydrogenase/leucine dehydrogenase